jgi:hypothetical protein
MSVWLGGDAPRRDDLHRDAELDDRHPSFGKVVMARLKVHLYRDNAPRGVLINVVSNLMSCAQCKQIGGLPKWFGQLLTCDCNQRMTGESSSAHSDFRH